MIKDKELVMMAVLLIVMAFFYGTLFWGLGRYVVYQIINIFR